MSLTRRGMLKRIIAGSAVVMVPFGAFAEWMESAFKADSYSAALAAMGAEGAVPSDKISLVAPEIAENGAVVPVQVSSTLDDIESISLFVEKNPNPMTAEFKMFPGLEPDFKVRVRMGETSKVIAVVKAGGKAYTAESEVKVTIGGCGG
ncbi:MAG TPA: thiosulfate oxidation carrier protein SoxY [Gammaproteobacteria bacterium]|nr:thiosulfate oxidation carrier protein SoxY [Xanthomonadales bacterium]HOP22071.1 thiosulfate oxidation carrier protein SoxY [Gammaproteobacteria bacterium]HPI95058.1 thiosulfate oxidation carrier protein SoxY [Gammaproteobacteria bacterium]HPQ87002.1 thiosulfate oxidation carrier protein SoxY [Gammaproteobacteria bacterium]